MYMFGSVDQFVGVVSSGIEVLAAIIVGYGALASFYKIAIQIILRRAEPREYERARISLGRYLVIALEFELGADILQTAIAPTWNHIGIVAAIIVLRSVLNFVLEREIEYLERRISGQSG